MESSGWYNYRGWRRGSSSVRLVVSVVLAVAGRPRLWGTALRQWRLLTPGGWWRRRPFLPVPDRHYLEFRLLTQYGNLAHADVGDVVNYLTWCRQMRYTARRA
jgi:hypothetical protein